VGGASRTPLFRQARDPGRVPIGIQARDVYLTVTFVNQVLRVSGSRFGDGSTMIAAMRSDPLTLSAGQAPDDQAELRLLRALADPTRYRIFLNLLRGETCNCELAQALDLSSNLVSHHLRQLRAAGLIQEHRDPTDARWLHISIDPRGLAAARAMMLPLFDVDQIEARTPVCGVSTTARR
jgi:DNA-binding transcriptional ArsR family regulator